LYFGIRFLQESTNPPSIKVYNYSNAQKLSPCIHVGRLIRIQENALARLESFNNKKEAQKNIPSAGLNYSNYISSSSLVKKYYLANPFET